MAKKKAAKAETKITGESLEAMASMGQIPPPPPGAFDGLPQGPVMIRRGGKLVPAEDVPGYGGARMPSGPAHSMAGHAPLPAGFPGGLDGGVGNASFGHYDTGVKRSFNSTFHEPPQEVTHARSVAHSLRMTLGQTVTQMELAYHEAVRVLKAAKTSEVLRAECEREGIDLAQVKAFSEEVDDVLRIFVPVEEPEG